MDTYIIIIIIVVILLCCCCISSSISAFLMSQSSSRSPSSGSSNTLPSTNTSENKKAADRETADRETADRSAADRSAADKHIADKMARADKEDKKKFIDIVTLNLQTEKQYLNEISQNEREIEKLSGYHQLCSEGNPMSLFMQMCEIIRTLRGNIGTISQKKSELYKKFENDYNIEMKKYNLTFPQTMHKDELLFEKFISELKK